MASKPLRIYLVLEKVWKLVTIVPCDMVQREAPSVGIMQRIPFGHKFSL